MKVPLEDALSLLSKYAEERTRVRAVLGTPSVSVARVVGTIRVSIVGGVPHLLIGKDDSESDQIKFRLSDCEFAYGDFRDEESAAFQLLWSFLNMFFSKPPAMGLRHDPFRNRDGIRDGGLSGSKWAAIARNLGRAIRGKESS